jgi:hypothetical protein
MEQRPLDWVTDFDTAGARASRSRALTVGLAGLFGGGAFAAVALIITALTRSAEEESGRGATVAPTASPPPTVVQSPATPVSVLPSGCGGLFSEAMTVTLDQLGFTLSSRYDGPWHTGSADEQLRGQLDAAAADSRQLSCHWTSASAGLLTRVTEVDAQQLAAATARLEQLDSTLLSEHGGQRYVIERQGAAGATGESHFFREGVWFATHWLEHGQQGYTADMVRSVFD